MENKVYFNFSYLALKLLGSGLYSNPWNAISELVANGFDAGATQIYIYINKSSKENSTIEIFDNGFGMTYEDLVNKYVFVGRNKRLDLNDNSPLNIKVLGRKGIGKLATLYLSNNVELISKTRDYTTSWNLNINEINEDERPALVSIDINSINISCSKEWNRFNSGFFLKLNNVNLTGLGEKTIQGLMNRLSDFYLLNSDKRQIYFAYTESENQEIKFSKVQKQIAYKNFYALFNNSDIVFPGFENNKVKVKTDFPELLNGYQVISLDHNDFDLKGKTKFIGINGELVEKEYTLIGWIGIHTSIEMEEARKNDDNFLKNRVTSPNRLRLYVRDKLAIDNFLDYLKNTQAFANYIEGEISFDILDDDDLPDIATANRQQLSEKDDRVQKLIEIIRPIINKLISTRVRLSSIVKEDEQKIRENREEQQRKVLKEALNEATLAKDKAIYEVEIRKKQVELLSKGLNKDVVKLAQAIHTINKNIVSIDNKFNSFFKNYGGNKIAQDKVMKDISKIKLINQKSLLLTKYAFKGNFELNSKWITTNIGLFIEQYIHNILEPDINVKVNFDDRGDLKFTFDTTEMGIIIDNLISNSSKAKAENLTINVDVSNNIATIDFIDDGIGIDKNNVSNPDILFELGARYSDTPGFGIGLHHIREIVRKHNGEAVINTNIEKGFHIVITLENKNLNEEKNT